MGLVVGEEAAPERQISLLVHRVLVSAQLREALRKRTNTQDDGVRVECHHLMTMT